MKISRLGLLFIKDSRGFTCTPKVSTWGRSYIGFAHKQTGGYLKTISVSLAEEYLKMDIAPIEKYLARVIACELGQSQFDAICSLVLDIGTASFSRSDMLRVLNDNCPKIAAKEFLRYTQADRLVNNVLVARRRAERRFFLKGEVLLPTDPNTLKPSTGIFRIDDPIVGNPYPF